MRLGIRLLIIVMFALLLSSPKLINKGSADGGANHQGRNLNFGVSGGNVNDITKRFCCSGTLGALLTDGTTSYILSNNHVLGLSGNANAGDDISQPGRIDNNCQTPTIVADFTAAPQLGPSNVDAAIAQLRPGAMDANGYIEDYRCSKQCGGCPAVGLSVAKSGRTTGFTTGTIGSINTSVSVQYQAGCGQGKKFVVSYTNQVVIGRYLQRWRRFRLSDRHKQQQSQSRGPALRGQQHDDHRQPDQRCAQSGSAALGRTVNVAGTTQGPR